MNIIIIIIIIIIITIIIIIIIIIIWLCLTRTGNYKIHKFDWLKLILTVV